MSERPQARGWAGIWLVVIIALTALPPLLLYPLPSHDGHQHVFTAFALSRLSDTDLGFARYLVSETPLSSQGWVYLLVGLDGFLPFGIAERLALALLLAMFPVGGVAYARLVGRPALPVVGLLALTAHSWVLLMGFYNFMFAFAFTPIIIGLAVRMADLGATPGGAAANVPDAESPRRSGFFRRTVLFSGVLVGFLCLAWLHVFAAAFAGIVAVAVTLGRSRRDMRSAHWWVDLLLIGAAGAPSGLYAWWVSQSYIDSHLSAGVIADTSATFEPISTRFADLLRTGAGGISFVTGLVFVGLAGWSVVRALRSGSEQRRLPGLLFAVAMVFVAAFLVSPIGFARWAYFSPRFIVCAMVTLSLAVCSALPKLRYQLTFSLLVSVGLVASTLSLSHLHRTLDPITQAVVNLPRLPGQTVLPLELGSERIAPQRYAAVTQHLPLRTLMNRGGISPYLFAFNPTIHAVVFRDSLEVMVGPTPGFWVGRGYQECPQPTVNGVSLPTGPASPGRTVPDPTAQRACIAHRIGLSDRLAVFGLAWGDLLLLHPPPILSVRLRERGYTLVDRTIVDDEPAVELWRARPASISFELQIPQQSLPAPVVVRAGLEGSVGWAFRAVSQAGDLPAPSLSLTISPLPAGSVDFEVFLDLDGDGELSDGEWHWRPDGLVLAPEETTEVTAVIYR